MKHMKNPCNEIQTAYLRKIARELALLNILLFVGLIALVVLALINWAA
jgi:hypothetical protein